MTTASRLPQGGSGLASPLAGSADGTGWAPLVVTVPAMFAAVRTPTADPFGPLASELAQAVNQGSAVGLRITAVHDDSAGTSIQVEWTIDGQPGTQTIATR